MEENFCMECNTEWKIFSVEWKKIARLECGKIVFHFIPYYTLLTVRGANQSGILLLKGSGASESATIR